MTWKWIFGWWRREQCLFEHLRKQTRKKKKKRQNKTKKQSNSSTYFFFIWKKKWLYASAKIFFNYSFPLLLINKPLEQTRMKGDGTFREPSIVEESEKGTVFFFCFETEKTKETENSGKTKKKKRQKSEELRLGTRQIERVVIVFSSLTSSSSFFSSLHFFFFFFFAVRIHEMRGS